MSVDVKNPSAEEQLVIAKRIIRNTLWRAHRYADGRSSYAPGMFNESIDLAINQLGMVDLCTLSSETGSIYAVDGMLGKWDPELKGFVQK